MLNLEMTKARPNQCLSMVGSPTMQLTTDFARGCHQAWTGQVVKILQHSRTVALMLHVGFTDCYHYPSKDQTCPYMAAPVMEITEDPNLLACNNIVTK